MRNKDLENAWAVQGIRQEKCAKLEEENKKLKDSNTILQKGGQVVFTLEKRIDELLEKNKKLKEEVEQLKAIIDHYKKFEEGKNKLEGMLMEEDTLQELRDLGKI